MNKLKVFVSSTVSDLNKERSVVKHTLEEIQFNAFLNEYESPKGMAPCGVCLSQINECDIFLLIIGEKYGFIPDVDETPDSPYDGKISITHGEFLKARELRKPILVFVKETPREDLENAFVNNLGDFLDGQFYAKFSAEDELRRKILEAIPQLLVSLVRHNYVSPWKRKPNVIIAESSDEASRIGAEILGYAIQHRDNPNVGLFAGRSASDIYYKFFQKFSSDQMKNIVHTRFFSVTEHFGISKNNSNSYYHWFHQAFFNKVQDIWGFEIPERHKDLVPSSIDRDTVDGFKIMYDQYLQINKVDIQLISPAPNGQIICIDPSYCSLEEILNMGTSIVRYSKETSNYLVPISPHEFDIVIGIKNLLRRSERLVVFASGTDKKDVVRRMIIGPVGSDCPASLVSFYPRENNLLYVIDKEGSLGLPKEVERHVNLIPSDRWQQIW